MQTVYGIYDLVAGEVVGPLMQFAGDAPAARMFRDVAQDKSTAIGQHPSDYQLLCFGSLSADCLTVFPRASVVMTGHLLEVSGES